jgi:nitroreductase
MPVADAIASRKSIRAFTNQPVSSEIVREILEQSARAPSASNLQPWHVYALIGDARDALIDHIQKNWVITPKENNPNIRYTQNIFANSIRAVTRKQQH